MTFAKRSETPSGKSRPREIALNKPRGYVVTRRDERGRRTVYDLLPEWARAWVPVGRLDADSKGLLLLTRDGALVEALTRPGACDKTYEVWVRGRVTDEHLASLRAKSVERLGGAGPKSRLRVVLNEGKNRQVRRMFGALRDPKFGTPLKVVKLTRIAIGPLKLDVPSGRWRFLTASETARLRAPS
jgi:23S rRNA pseudouridine2605 synthase